MMDTSPVPDFSLDDIKKNVSSDSQNKLLLESSYNSDDVLAYKQNESREFFADDHEREEFEKRATLMQQEIETEHKLGQDILIYRLDVTQSREEINTKLSFVRRDQNFERDWTISFPREKAKTNYMDLLTMQLFEERQFIFEKYVEQGYLGRFLMYLIDKIIQASITSFKLLR